MLPTELLWGWWKQAAGCARRAWGCLTSDRGQLAAGERDTLYGLLLEASCYRAQQAEAEVDRLLADWQAGRD